MRFVRHFIASLLLAGWLSVAVQAQDAAVSGNPYLAVVARNVFALVPIPTVDPASQAPPADPPPKITPNGIMNIFGHLQVLFKVATKPLPGQPPKDESHVMSEGERQDEIEVVKIDGKAGVVTFNNHGTVQELALVVAPASGGSPGAPAPGGRVNLGFPLPRGVSAGGGRFGRPAVNADVIVGANNLAAPSVAAPNRVTETTEALTPEAQVIMMEAQRAQWKQQGNAAAAIIPPTPLSRLLNGEEGNGTPLPSPPIP